MSTNSLRMVSELHFLNPLKLAKMARQQTAIAKLFSPQRLHSPLLAATSDPIQALRLSLLFLQLTSPLALFRERHGRKLARFLSNSTFHCNLPAFELCRMKCHLESDLHFPIVHKVAAMQIEINSGQVSIENQVTPTQSLSLSSGKQYFLGRILLLCMCSVCVWCSSYIN